MIRTETPNGFTLRNVTLPGAPGPITARYSPEGELIQAFYQSSIRPVRATEPLRHLRQLGLGQAGKI